MGIDNKNFQNGIASIIVALTDMRDNPRKKTAEHMKNLIMIEKLLPEIKRALIYFQNSVPKIDV